MLTQQTFITGALTGAGTSVGLSFVILFLSTLNLLIALFATITILCEVACILGFMFILGWELGIVESIAATILVGLSVGSCVPVSRVC